MDFRTGIIRIVFDMIRMIIAGVVGALLWNTVMPLIFEGVPKIDVIQAMVLRWLVVALVSTGGERKVKEEKGEVTIKELVNKEFEKLADQLAGDLSVVAIIYIWILFFN